MIIRVKLNANNEALKSSFRIELVVKNDFKHNKALITAKKIPIYFPIILFFKPFQNLIGMKYKFVFLFSVFFSPNY